MGYFDGNRHPINIQRLEKTVYEKRVIVCIGPSATSNTSPREKKLFRLSSVCVVSRVNTMCYTLVLWKLTAKIQGSNPVWAKKKGKLI